MPLVVLHADPADWLYHLLQTWPVPSTSGEIVLVRRDGDQVLYLNELRHRKGSALQFRVPLANREVLAAQVLRGEVRQGEVVTGRDYRGKPAVGVVRAIPGTDWYLLAKLDRAELYDEAIRGALWMGLSGVLALFGAAVGLALARKRQQLAVADSVRLALAERLRALNLLDAIADGSGDAIFAKDQQGRFILFNQAASRFVGKPAEDVLGYDERAIFPAEQAEVLMELDRRLMAEGRSHTQEDVIDTPAGKNVFLVTKGPLRDAEGKISGLFGIARDITERKQGEDALRREVDERKATEESLRRQAGELAERNAELERFNRATVGRELDMVELKRQVNRLSERLGEPPPYPLAFLDDAAPGDGK